MVNDEVGINWLKVVLKLAAAGATIAAFAFGIVTLSPDGEVAETEADVLDFAFGPKDRTEVYQGVLKRLGHPEPEAYDLNGNVVYFSSTFAKGSPREVMAEYQRTLKDQGYNHKAYGEPQRDQDSQMEFAEGLLFGDMVPIDVEDARVIMASGTTDTNPRTKEDLVNMGIPSSASELRDRFTGHKWVEIMRHSEYDDSSLVISSWADDFNIKKMVPGNREEDQNVDTTVPPCPGCTRTVKFDSLNDQKVHRQTGFADAASVSAASGYYVDAMGRRGWELTETSKIYQRVQKDVAFEGNDAAVLQFTKDDEFVTILAYPEENGASVHVVEGTTD